MIISEKQILLLIHLAEYVRLRWSAEDNEAHALASTLLREIQDQQSEELQDMGRVFNDK